jgi:hypothetical protein
MLTQKGRAAALLIRVRDSWEQLNPQQQAECSAILDRLQAAMRREDACQLARVRVPLVARLSA